MTSPRPYWSVRSRDGPHLRPDGGVQGSARSRSSNDTHRGTGTAAHPQALTVLMLAVLFCYFRPSSSIASRARLPLMEPSEKRSGLGPLPAPIPLRRFTTRTRECFDALARSERRRDGVNPSGIGRGAATFMPLGFDHLPICSPESGHSLDPKYRALFARSTDTNGARYSG